MNETLQKTFSNSSYYSFTYGAFSGIKPQTNFLCVNQAQKIRFTAETNFDLPDPSQIEWEVSPSSAGSFVGAATGKEVLWEQADDFVSSWARDVVITAKIGPIHYKEFKLTVARLRNSATIYVTPGGQGCTPDEDLVPIEPPMHVDDIALFGAAFGDTSFNPANKGWTVIYSTEFSDDNQGQFDYKQTAAPNVNLIFNTAQVFPVRRSASEPTDKLRYCVSILPNAPPGDYRLIKLHPTDGTKWQHQERVVVFDIQLKTNSNGKVEVERGKADTITAIVYPLGATIDHYEWVFTGGREGTKTTTGPSTTVFMVDGENEYKVKVKLFSDATTVIREDEKVIEVKARDWVTPMTLSKRQLTIQEWTDVPILADPLEQQSDGGINLNSQLDNTPIFTPYTDSGQGPDFFQNNAIEIAQVLDINGPNHEYRYVENTEIKLDIIWTINPTWLPSAPLADGTDNFYSINHNKPQILQDQNGNFSFSSTLLMNVDDLIATVESHEEKHFENLKIEAEKNEYDIRKQLEKLFAPSQTTESSFKDTINAKWIDIQDVLKLVWENEDTVVGKHQNPWNKDLVDGQFFKSFRLWFQGNFNNRVADEYRN